MNSISFRTDADGFPDFQAADLRWTALGVWFIMELRNSPYQCLDLLAIVDDVASGRAEQTEWDGEAFQVRLTRAEVDVRNTILEDQRGSYPLDEVRRAAEDYWRYLSDRPEVAADITDWEQTWHRTHPYRGRLF